jgi:hypothetical protein
MTQTELEPRTLGWLRWEWRAALITVVGGFILLTAVVGYLTYRAVYVGRAYVNAAQKQAQINVEAQIALCTASLTHAKEFGIVPNYGKLSGPGLQLTNVKGRYACTAATSVAQYTLLTDLVCRDLRDRRCTALYSVVQQDGTVLYRRQS